MIFNIRYTVYIKCDRFMYGLCFVFIFCSTRNEVVATIGNLFRWRRMGVLLVTDSAPPLPIGVGRAGSAKTAAVQILSFHASWCYSSFSTLQRM